MSIEAMKQALEALENCTTWSLTREQFDKNVTAITVLRTAIAEAEKSNIKQVIHLYDEPPAAQSQWLGLEPSDMPDGDDPMYDHDFFLKGMAWADAILRKKNTTPPAAQRQWVGLTREEISELWVVSRAALPRYATYASIVQAKLKEKNHG